MADLEDASLRGDRRGRDPGVLGLSAWIVASHLNAIVVAPECWAQWAGSDGPHDTCSQLVGGWLDIHEHEAGQLTGLLGYLPIGAGAILGVPIVARELELRTASLAWSLEGRRWRWLASRLWPMLFLALLGGALVGVASSGLRVAQTVTDFETPYITDIARQGPVLFSQVLVGIGVGVLAGSVAARTLPAFMLAGLMAVAWLAAGGPAVEHFVAEDHATYVTQDAVNPPDGRPQMVPLQWLGDAYKEQNGHMVDGDLYERLCRSDANGEDVCPDPFPPAGYIAMIRMVPQSAWVPIEQAETAAGLAVATLTILATFPVVARRRPG